MGGPGSGRYPAGSGGGSKGFGGARPSKSSARKITMKGRKTNWMNRVKPAINPAKSRPAGVKNRYVPFPLLPKDNAKLAKSGKYAG